MINLLMIVLIALVVYSCGSSSGEAKDETQVAEQTQQGASRGTPVEESLDDEDDGGYTVNGKPVTIAVNEGMQIQDLGSFLLVCSEAVVHDAQCFTLEEYTGDKSLFMDWNKRQVSPQRLVYFKVSDITVVDGRRESELVGYFNIGMGWFKVMCGASVDMSEPDPDPKWCFPFLATLQLVEQPS